TIDAATCETMTGAFRFGRQRYKRSFSAARAQVSTSCTRGGDTFALIEQRVFALRGCTVTSCHAVFGQASLDLLRGSSYEHPPGGYQLVLDGPTLAPGEGWRAASGCRSPTRPTSRSASGSSS